MTRLLLAVSIALLVACAPEKEPEGVIPEHQLNSMHKAEDVEAMMQKAEQERRDQMDNQ